MMPNKKNGGAEPDLSRVVADLMALTGMDGLLIIGVRKDDAVATAYTLPDNVDHRQLMATAAARAVVPMPAPPGKHSGKM